MLREGNVSGAGGGGVAFVQVICEKGPWVPGDPSPSTYAHMQTYADLVEAESRKF